jgi:hypothetical protein
MPEEYTTRGQRSRQYQYFDAPTNFKEDVYVQMAEARPNWKSHVRLFRTTESQHGSKGAARVGGEGSLKNTPFYRDGF